MRFSLFFLTLGDCRQIRRANRRIPLEKSFYNYIKPHWKWAILSPLFVATEVWAELAQPYFMSRIVDEGIVVGNASVILPLGVQMLVITLIGMVGGVLSIFAAGIVSHSVGADLRHAIFAKALRLSPHEAEETQVGTLITGITQNANKVQGVIQSSMRLLYRAPILFVGAVVMFLTVSGELSSALLILLPLLLFCIIHTTRKVFPLSQKAQGESERLNKITQEFLSGIKVVKAFNQEGREAKRFSDANRALNETSDHIARRVSALGPAMSFIINIGISFVVYWAAKLMDAEGDVNVGEIMAITSYLTQILLSLMMAQHIIIAIAEARTSWRKITQLTKGNIEGKDFQKTAEASEGKEFQEKITFSNVSFSYTYKEGNENSIVLRNISFEISAGETIGIIGGTGSGKSSIAQLLLRNYPPLQGTISIGGKPLEDFPREEVHRHIGWAAQSAQLFSGSIADNLRFGKEDATEDEMREACQIAQIDQFIASLEDGYEYQLAQGGGNLSGGQRQRLSLARTLIGKPKILVMDDCLNAVDLQTGSHIMRRIRQLHCTKIIISQHINTIRHADRILVLEKGQIAGIGTHDELMAKSPIYQEIFHSQND